MAACRDPDPGKAVTRRWKNYNDRTATVRQTVSIRGDHLRAHPKSFRYHSTVDLRGLRGSLIVITACREAPSSRTANVSSSGLAVTVRPAEVFRKRRVQTSAAIAVWCGNLLGL